MEHSDLAEEDYRNAAAFAFTDLSTQLRKQGLDVMPLDVGAGRAGEYQLKRALMLAPHAPIWYHRQVPTFGSGRGEIVANLGVQPPPKRSAGTAG